MRNKIELTFFVLILWPPVSYQHEVLILAFGAAAPGLGSMYRSIAVWEMAVEELGRKYSNSLNVCFVFVPARNCLPAVEKNNDILAKWYYQLEKPDRTIVMVNTGAEFGKRKYYKT